MLRFSRFLLSRSTSRIQGISSEGSNRLHNFTTTASFSSGGHDLATKVKYEGIRFADYSIFKGKAALSLRPISPKFNKLNSGGFRVEKKGSVMLAFWPAIGPRKYDWQKRQFFALSAVELGSLISLGPEDSCEFFHDPSMKTSLAGQVRKSLHVVPMADDAGYHFNLSVVNNNAKTHERMSVPVSKAEFAVMRTSFSHILPHIMGWDCINPTPLPLMKVAHMPTESGLLLSPDSEWDR